MKIPSEAMIGLGLAGVLALVLLSGGPPKKAPPKHAPAPAPGPSPAPAAPPPDPTTGTATEPSAGEGWEQGKQTVNEGWEQGGGGSGWTTGNGKAWKS